MNMQALQQDTLLQGGKYRIEKILNETDFEITYLSDKFGSDADVTITEFFMKDICGREGNRVTYGSDDTQNDAIRMRDKFKKDAESQDSNYVIDVFEENDTVYYVRENKEEGVVIADDNVSETEPNKKEPKKKSLLSKLKWPLIAIAALGAGVAFFSSSEPPVKKETTTGTSQKKVETKPVEPKNAEPAKVEQESAAFAPIMEKMAKVKKDALAMPGVSQHKVLTGLSDAKNEFEKTKSKLTADEQERFHKEVEEIIEIIKKRS